jgi:hypothetical protein
LGWFVAACAALVIVLAGASCTLLAPSRSDFEGGDIGALPDAAQDAPADATAIVDAAVPTITLWEGAGFIAGAVGGTVAAFTLRTASGGQVLTVNVQRPNAATVVVSNLSAPSSIDSDGSIVVWLDSPPSGGAVWRMPRAPDGGAPRSIAQDSPRAVALALGSRVQWISGRSILATDGELQTAPVALATNQAAPIALTFSSSAFYWINGETGEIWTRELAQGATARKIIDGQAGATALAVHQRTLYWIREGHVVRAQSDGTGMTAIASEAGGAIAADESGVYWLVGTGVRRVRHGAVAVESLVDQFAGCDTVLALDSTSVLFACNADGRARLLRFVK